MKTLTRLSLLPAVLLFSSVINGQEPAQQNESSETAESSTVSDEQTATTEEPADKSADEPKSDGQQPNPELEKLVEQLNEASLTKRRKARTQLREAGADAIPYLAKAALSGKRDAIASAIEILGEIHRDSKDEAAREAAKVTLEMLADSDQPSTAERAKRMLSVKKADGIEAFPEWNDPKSEFAGGGGMNRSISVSSINGMKTIRVEEGGKITTIRDERRGAIRVITEEGEEKREIVARNADDLKTKDPAAYELYSQQSNGFGGAGMFPGFPGGGQFQFGNGVAGGNAQINGNNQMAQEMMVKQLEELQKRFAGNPQMQQALQQQIDAMKP